VIRLGEEAWKQLRNNQLKEGHQEEDSGRNLFTDGPMRHFVCIVQQHPACQTGAADFKDVARENGKISM